MWIKLGLLKHEYVTDKKFKTIIETESLIESGQADSKIKGQEEEIDRHQLISWANEI